MSRRRATLLAAALLLVAACGKSRNEAAPARAAASEPTAVAAPAPADKTPEAPSPAEATSATPAAPSAATVAAKTPAEPEPPFTPGTSLPGAIPPSPAPEVKPDKPEDPLEWLQKDQARQAERQKRVAEAEASVAIAEASVRDWQNTILAFKNPFRPRPQLAPEDQQAIEGMDGVARVAWAEGKLAAANAVLDDARKRLADLKANPTEN